MFIFYGDDEKQLLCLFDKGLGDPFRDKGEFNPEFMPEFFLFTLIVVEIGDAILGVLAFFINPFPDVFVLIFVKFLLLKRLSLLFTGVVS